MITEHEHINNVLLLAENIFFLEEDGRRIMLVYDKGNLYTNSTFGLASKPISDVKKITFHYDLDAWEVIWKV